MLNLQITNESEILLNELKKDLEEKISILQCRVESALSSISFGIERKPYWEKNEEEDKFTLWMQGYTLQLRNAEYQLEWYEKQYKALISENN